MSSGFVFCWLDWRSFTYVDFGFFLFFVEAIKAKGGRAKTRRIKTYTHNSYHHDV